VVEYLYTGRVAEIELEIVVELLVAVDLLGLWRLIQICEIALQPLLSPQNVVSFLVAAQFHHAEQLKQGRLVRLHSFVQHACI
jgi:hypothetical protein